MTELIPTIGLEIHAELKTATKMFCRSKNDPDEKRPNVNVCPVCLAHPGALPTINKKAVEHVLRVGLALGGQLADYTEFDRKNYFYPDIPKGYQISQYKFPLVTGGELLGVKLTRIHLEEDTANSKHDQGDFSLVDFNRAGVPLMELVTEPVIASAKQAEEFARELQLTLRYLGVSEANMEKGEMRIEANVSVAPAGQRGTKIEIKNINSFRALREAIESAIKMLKEKIKDGEEIVQETWGSVFGKTGNFGINPTAKTWGTIVQQRKKESSHDYRYFPDPDLPKLKISAIPEFQNLTLPELPWQKRSRYQKLGLLQEQDIEQLLGDVELAKYFDEIAAELKTPELIKPAANFILNDIAGQRRKDSTQSLPDVPFFVKVIRDYVSGKLASPQVKSSILSGQAVSVIDENALPALVQKIIDENPKIVADYKSGKKSALQYLVGQSMKETKGAANPEILQKLFMVKLSG